MCFGGAFCDTHFCMVPVEMVKHFHIGIFVDFRNESVGKDGIHCLGVGRTCVSGWDGRQVDLGC